MRAHTVCNLCTLESDPQKATFRIVCKFDYGKIELEMHEELYCKIGLEMQGELYCKIRPPVGLADTP